MALFKKSESSKIYSFDKQKVISEIEKMLETEFPAYHIIKSKDDPWDFLIIKMVSKAIVVKLGTIGLHETIRECLFQEIFAVNVMSPDETIDDTIEKYASGWTKAHIIVSDAATLKRKLVENQNG